MHGLGASGTCVVQHDHLGCEEAGYGGLGLLRESPLPLIIVVLVVDISEGDFVFQGTDGYASSLCFSAPFVLLSAPVNLDLATLVSLVGTSHLLEKLPLRQRRTSRRPQLGLVRHNPTFEAPFRSNQPLRHLESRRK
jgi:hypothetical protein